MLYFDDDADEVLTALFIEYVAYDIGIGGLLVALWFSCNGRGY